MGADFLTRPAGDALSEPPAASVVRKGTPVREMLESREFLRPVERVVLRLVDEGVADVEIARRFRRSPEMIRRITAMARLPRVPRARVVQDDGLRPLERRLLHWRHHGATHAEIGSLFRRSPVFVARVEALARYKLEERAKHGN